MLPSKAERIFSRYRPIAPKPLPLPPSGSFGTTDPSSTCASIDSFTSSVKCKKSRKRKADDGSSSKGLKAPKSIGSGLSNTGGVSSLTQGVSDGTVPLRDLRSASQLSYGSIPHGIEDGTEMSNGATKEAGRNISQPRFAAYSGVVAPVHVADVQNIVHSQGLYITSDGAPHQQHHQFTLLHHALSTPDCNPNGMIAMDRDTGFMERAAAASSSVMPETASTVPVCDVGCARGLGHVGGGFTEMIRGITRLPTAADVQSLMQARASSTIFCGQGMGSTGSPSSLRLSPPSNKEVAQRKLEPSSLLTPMSHSWVLRSPASTDMEQMCDNDTDLVTLPLLPTVPSKMCSSSAVSHGVGSPAARTPSPARNGEASRQTQASPRADPSLTSFSGRCAASTYCPPFSSVSRKPASGFVGQTMNPHLMQVAGGSVMADGAAVDETYLEQVYGGSTDPVLLLDDNNNVLWYNKSYEKALKSASERLSGKTCLAGPYFDPLGHPTPLGTFIFPGFGEHVQATLWGFLKKLVIQENEMSLEHGMPGPSSHLRLSMGVIAQRPSPPASEPVSRMKTVTCPRNPWLTTMTLERITDVQMEVPTIAECVEGSEARLGASNVPAFITDCLNRVKWVNVALKQMLGRMGPDASGSLVSPTSKVLSGSLSNGLTEFFPAFTICCAEKVPSSAWAFSCRINVEWTKGGRRRSMTVPCDVTRIIANTRAPEVQWAWQFDMAGSLSLNALS